MSTEPDGTTYPWVEDFDEMWHLRPPTDEWVASDDGPNATTQCGLMVPAVHVSENRPNQDADWICEACEDAQSARNP